MAAQCQQQTHAHGTILRTSLIACLSSATTIIIFLFLLRPGSNNIITSVVDRVRMTSSEDVIATMTIASTATSTGASTSTKPITDTKKFRDTYFLKKFLEDPWKVDPYDMAAAAAVDYGEKSNGDVNVGSTNLNLTKETWWDRLLTPNGGFLMVEGEDDHEDEPEPVGYGVSMFHQLHCLDMLRRRVLEDDQKTSSSHIHGPHRGTGSVIQVHAQIDKRDMTMMERFEEEEEKVSEKEGEDEDEEEQDLDREEKLRKFETMHLLHCFEYIAQAILCAADDALEVSEPTELGNGEQVNGVNGENEVHQCRDASVLYDFVARSREKPVLRGKLGRYSIFG